MVKKLFTDVGVKALKPGPVRREIHDAGCRGLLLVIHPTGNKSWAMRFRRPGGKLAKLTLGSFDPTAGKKASTTPKIGQPLTLGEARVLATNVTLQRKQDQDVVAENRVAKQKHRNAIQDRAANLFGQAALDFIKNYQIERKGHPHLGQRPRHWREDAKMLGLAYPLEGDDEPTIIKGGLCDRWRDKPIVEIDSDTILDLIEETQASGIPGLKPRKNAIVSNSRGRKMADALGAMFKWLRKKHRGLANPFRDMDRPAPPPKRKRFLNVDPNFGNADELRWFWKACDKLGAPFGSMCKILLLTGCRRDEIAHMRRNELSDDLSMLKLSDQRTKNSLPFTVPLPPLAREILTAIPRVSDDYVFSTNGRSPISGFSKFKQRLDELMLAEAKKEKAVLVPWMLHDLRRSCSTGMGNIGVYPHIVEAVLNHVSGSKAGIAGDYNQAAYAKEKKEALERWADHAAAIVAEERNKRANSCHE